MLVVHPAYWQRGHGTKLMAWGQELAKLDGVKRGVFAAKMGEKMYLSMHFKKLDDVNATDADNHEQKISVGVLEYIPHALEAEL